MSNSADCDPSPNAQPELPFAPGRFKGRDLSALLSDPAFRECVANIWSRYQPLLLELAHYHLRDSEQAQEVVQDTWVDFIESIPRFEGRCSEKTWLVQILEAMHSEGTTADNIYAGARSIRRRFRRAR